MSKVTSPPEKKRLAYQRDHYNRNGQHNKAWRETKPCKKAKARWAFRKASNDLLRVSGPAPEDVPESVTRKQGSIQQRSVKTGEPSLWRGSWPPGAGATRSPHDDQENVRPQPHAMDIYNQLDELILAVKRAESTLPRLSALLAFFAAGQQELSNESSPDHSVVFYQAALLLGERVADGVIWDWWQEQARVATTPKRQGCLHATLFELVPENPIIWSDFYRFWDFWFDPAARWAVFSAYWRFPRRLPVHLARYIAHRRRQKLPIPEFSHEEFHAWLSAHKRLNQSLPQTAG